MKKNTVLFIIASLLVITVFIFLLIITLFPYQQTPTTSIISPTPSSTKPTTSQFEELNRQTDADINVNNIQNSVLEKYPWYNQLPIQKDNYFVYFDVPKKTFIALLYPQTSSSISQEQQVENFKSEIILKLNELGVDTNLFLVEYDIKPE